MKEMLDIKILSLVMNEPSFYNVDIFKGHDTIQTPSFKLEVITHDLKAKDGYRIEKYQVTLSKLKTKGSYKAFYDKFSHNLMQYNPSLEDWIETILFKCLSTYRTVVELIFEQDSFFNSKLNLKYAKPLADIFLLLETSRVQNPTITTSLTVGGIPHVFDGAEFNTWLVDLIKQAIIDGNYPLDLGDNMIELQSHLKKSDTKKLNGLANRDHYNDLIENSEPITDLCLEIHQFLCAILKLDSSIFTVNQLSLYSYVINVFEIPNSTRYILNSTSSTKKSLDSFRLLLKRAFATQQIAIAISLSQ